MGQGPHLQVLTRLRREVCVTIRVLALGLWLLGRTHGGRVLWCLSPLHKSPAVGSSRD